MEESLFQFIHTIVESLLQKKFDCDRDSKNELGLMHIALKAVTASYAQTAFVEMSPSPKLVTGTSVGPENNRDENLLKSRLLEM